MNFRMPAAALLMAGLIAVASASSPREFRADHLPGLNTVAWGDLNCHDGPNAVDGLVVLLHVTSQLVTVPEGICDEHFLHMDSELMVGGVTVQWADVDCRGATNSVNALKLLRHAASLPVVQTAPCPNIGTTIEVVR